MRFNKTNTNNVRWNVTSPLSTTHVIEAKYLEDIMQLIEDEFGVKGLRKN
jgi:hypothetical protein